MIDYTITIGNIIEIAVIGGGGISALAVMRYAINALNVEIKEMKKDTKADIGGIQIEIKKMGEILIAQADIRGEMKVITTRITAVEGDIRELRHGRGFIQGERGLDHQYPRE